MHLIHGHVTDFDNHPVTRAEVTVTAEASRIVRRTNTDTGGRYTVGFTGDDRYLVLIRKIGYQPALIRPRGGGGRDDVTADAVLVSAPTTLAPLVALTGSTSPANPRALSATIGGAAADQWWFTTPYLPDPGNLSEYARLTLGVERRGDSAYSVMGISPDQNSTVLDGSELAQGALPPDAICGRSLVTTTSDPGQGHFAGGQTTAQSCSGSPTFTSTMRGRTDFPAFSHTGNGGSGGGASAFDLNGFLSGPVGGTNGRFHLALELARQTTTFSSPILSSDQSPSALSANSLNRLNAILGTLGVPTTGASYAMVPQLLRGSAFLRTDWIAGRTASIAASLGANIISGNGIGLGPYSYPAAGEHEALQSLLAMTRLSIDLFGAPDELTATGSYSHFALTPSLMLPHGTVRVQTGDTTGSVPADLAIAFGGGNQFVTSNSSSVELRNLISLGRTGGHNMRFGQDLLWQRSSGVSTGDSLGTFSFLSLEDLSRDAPSAYQRILGTASVTTRSRSFSAWVSDIWAIDQHTSLQGGLRFEATSYGGTRPSAARPPIDGGPNSAFPGTATTLAPRIGFAHLLKVRAPRTVRDRVTRELFTVRELGDDDLPGAIQTNMGDGLTLFGGVGAYQGRVSPFFLTSTVGSASNRLGQTLSCLGSAAPEGSWARGAAVPDHCNGAAASLLPTSSLFSPSFHAPTDWKANLALDGLSVGSWTLRLSAVARYEVHTPDVTDLNLTRTPQFSLDEEGGRPVFAEPSAIDAASGLIAPSAGRAISGLGPVYLLGSDVHSAALQLNARLSLPHLFGDHLFPFLSWSYNSQWYEATGFNATAGNSPFAVTRFSGSQPLQQFRLDLLDSHFGPVSADLQFDLQSGTRYTPLVAGDINGDGLANDRAFIFDPALPSGGATASSLATLLRNAPAGARRCLQQQIGTIAEAGSCRGPWQARMDASLSWMPFGNGPFSDRLEVNLAFYHVEAPLLRLIGRGSSLTSEGAPIDDRLLFVTGFDPAHHAFQYSVNGAFGQPVGAAASSAGAFPTLVRAQISYQFGGASPLAIGTQLALENAVSPSDVVALLQSWLPTLADTVLAVGDSLALDSLQRGRIEQLHAATLAREQSVAQADVAYLVSHRHRISDVAFRNLVDAVARRIRGVRFDLHSAVLDVLLPEQRLKLGALHLAFPARPL